MSSSPKGRRRIGAAKAAGLAIAALVPTIGLLVHLIADRPLARELTLLDTVVTALIFAGIPGVIVFASMGARLGAQAPRQSRARTLRIGASKGALTGLGLGLLVAIPTGALAHSVTGWVPLLLACAVVSAGIGALAAAWIYLRDGDSGSKASP